MRYAKGLDHTETRAALLYAHCIMRPQTRKHQTAKSNLFSSVQDHPDHPQSAARTPAVLRLPAESTTNAAKPRNTFMVGGARDVATSCREVEVFSQSPNLFGRKTAASFLTWEVDFGVLSPEYQSRPLVALGPAPKLAPHKKDSSVQDKASRQSCRTRRPIQEA